MLDGEGGYTVWGRLMGATDSRAKRSLPIGLAHRVKLKRDVAAGATVSWDDVDCDETSQAVRIRREMERMFGAGSYVGEKALKAPMNADPAPIPADD